MSFAELLEQLGALTGQLQQSHENEVAALKAEAGRPTPPWQSLQASGWASTGSLAQPLSCAWDDEDLMVLPTRERKVSQASKASTLDSPTRSLGPVWRPSHGESRVNIGARLGWLDIDEGALKEYAVELASRNIRRRRSGSSDVSMIMVDSLNSRASTLFVEHLESAYFRRRSTPAFLWEVFTMIFLAYELLVVPLAVFPVLDLDVLVTLEVVCSLVWTVDLAFSVVSFFIMREFATSVSTCWQDIACFQMVWLLHDAFCVVANWSALVVRDHSNATISTWHFPLRLAAVLRIAKIRRALRRWCVKIASERCRVCLHFLVVLAEFAFLFHLAACGWFWLGHHQQDGWVHVESHMQGAGLLYGYFYSSRWTIAQISGRTDLELRTTSEYAYTVLVCALGLTSIGLIISLATNTMIEVGSLHRENAKMLGHLTQYLQRQRVSLRHSHRAMVAAAAQLKWRNERLLDNMVLDLLPKQVMMDIFYEIRYPVIKWHPFISDFDQDHPRVVARVCSETLNQVSVNSNEVVFMNGDACDRMLFADTGLLVYRYRAAGCGSVKTNITRSPDLPRKAGSFMSSVTERSSSSVNNKVLDGQTYWLSEPALWVMWVNLGTLTATANSCLLALDATAFTKVTKMFADAHARCVLYARCYIAQLQDAVFMSDVVDGTVALSATINARTGFGFSSLGEENEEDAMKMQLTTS